MSSRPVRRHIVRRTVGPQVPHLRPRPNVMVSVRNPLTGTANVAVLTPGDTLRFDMTAVIETAGDFRLTTVPVEIQARVA